ncbi:protein of unknown function DUF324 [Thalassoporum mexicanum PCC 7367]|uniref:RAMP superfamily CRISPR-associated protein n=1 Tax=Thalassoporum mexicanum TaxID=3457544 RepID=UPI00029F9AC9|nr:RAMP superfamily CRISPR-associated protein [Pseudanabaena sp. PCC 7367]AFY68744.1 protein of unknown function DUF324 [Pseudanabaena sp. PCC 7367]
MHKRLVNHCTIEISIEPDGPVLVKSGQEGADPTKPSMEFVETYHQGGKSIYFPGSSLKGAIRAHAERIVRTIGSDRRPGDEQNKLWASDPLSECRDNNPNHYLDDWKKGEKNKKLEDREPNPGASLYKMSCFTTQLFGSTSVASRFRIEDAYPAPEVAVKTEERNGVAIDRVFGSVAVGPFNYQVCTAGKFTTKIHLKNFTLAQLALIGLVLRDLNEGWFGLGFAKSRGLGMVQVAIDRVVVQYPGCVLDNEEIKLIGNTAGWPHTSLLGAGMFLSKSECEAYGFPKDDFQDTSVPGEAMELGFGVELVWDSNNVKELFERAVGAWRKLLMPKGVAS